MAKLSALDFSTDTICDESIDLFVDEIKGARKKVSIADIDMSGLVECLFFDFF